MGNKIFRNAENKFNYVLSTNDLYKFKYYWNSKLMFLNKKLSLSAGAGEINKINLFAIGIAILRMIKNLTADLFDVSRLQLRSQLQY